MRALALLSALATSFAADHFTIRVLDEATGRGIPMVELRTTGEFRQFTDSHGTAVIIEPGLVNQEVYFAISSPGYRFPGEGRTIAVHAGGTEILRMRRENIAERLYRITGEGIYRDSVIAGIPVPLRQPLLNAKVTGQDSVVSAVYRDRIYWFWGDTNRLDGRLGHFATSGATSGIPSRGGLDPSLGIDLDYFTGPGGFARPVCSLSGPGMKWLYWVLALKDGQGRERLVARYRAMKDLGTVIESGIVLWNDDTSSFARYSKFERDTEARVPAHPFRAVCDGVEYIYLAEPLPHRRVRATLEAVADESAWETFTPSGWRKNVPTPAKSPVILHDVLTGSSVKAHAGSVHWNSFRRRWILIVQEDRGLSDNGEIWFAEADTPAGPWVYARKVVTHSKYTFYNPAHHPFFDQDGGRLIYFEGTYTDFLSGAKEKTPRYDYNQIMYRLALDDPLLALPVPVYRIRDGRYLMRDAVESGELWNHVEAIPFFALPGEPFRMFPSDPPPDVTGSWTCTLKDPDGGAQDFTLDLVQSGERLTGSADGTSITSGSLRGGELQLELRDAGTVYTARGTVSGTRLSLKVSERGKPGESLGHCDRKDPSPTASPDLVPLYQGRDSTGRITYSTSPPASNATPLGRVWRTPTTVLQLDRGVKPVHQ